jgi:hypothetical protein
MVFNETYLTPDNLGDPFVDTDQKLFACKHHKELLYKKLIRASGDTRIQIAYQLGLVVRAQRLLESAHEELEDRFMKLEHGLAEGLTKLEKIHEKREILRERNQELFGNDLSSYTRSVSISGSHANISKMSRQEVSSLLNFYQVPFPEGISDSELMNTNELRNELLSFITALPQPKLGLFIFCVSYISDSELNKFLCYLIFKTRIT